jgi:hypothetical protein
MKRVILTVVVGFAALALGIAVLAPVSAAKLPGAAAGGRPLTADLSGANEVPPADPAGTGFARVTLNPGRETVCFDIVVENIAPAAAAHIHRGGAGVNGPVVVNFDVPTNGLSGCVSADRELIKEIMKDPAGFYVNVHNAEFPAGAVRGQLSS